VDRRIPSPSMRAIVSATSISRSWSTDLSRIGSLTTQTLPQGVCWHLFGRAAPLGLKASSSPATPMIAITRLML
jgi:hypothetical protein